MNHKKAKNAKQEGEKLRIQIKLVWKFHEIEVCHMSSRLKRNMNYFRGFMKLVQHSGNIGLEGS